MIISRRSPAPSGFTLIEMLIAVVLVGLLTAALFGGLRFGTRAVSAADREIDHASQLALIYGFLQARLDDAQPFPASADTGDHEIIFDGTPDSVEFVTTAPAQVAAGGFFRLRLAPVRSGTRLRLETRWQTLSRRNPPPGAGEIAPSVLLDHVAGARFAYFGSFAADDSREWHESWQAADHLPMMIRLRVDFADGWHAPDLIVAPRLAAQPEQG